MPRVAQPPTRPTATCCSAAAATNDRAPGDANGFRAVGEGEAPRGKSARLYGGARLTAEKIFEQQLNEPPSRWQIPPIMEELKQKARAAGLWNLFLPESEYG